MSKLLSILLVSLVLPFSSNAQNIVTDRPDQTESAAVINPGSFQMESGCMFTLQKLQLLENREFQLPNMLLRIGLINGLELRLFTPLCFESNRVLQRQLNQSTHFGQIEVGFKLHIYGQDDALKICYMAHTIWQNRSRFNETSTLSVVQKLLVSNKLNDRWNLGYNLGYQINEEGLNNLLYTISLNRSLGEKTGIFAETYAVMDANDRLYYVDFGFTRLVHHNQQVDISAGFGLSDASFFISTGYCFLR